MKKITKGKLFVILTPFLVVLGLAVILTSTRKTDTYSTACTSSNFSGKFEQDFAAAFEGDSVRAPRIAEKQVGDVLGVAVLTQRWIEIDLSEQKLRAWDGNNLFLETLISTGLPWWPTPVGEFRIWIKLRYTKMEGGEGKYYYYLPNVPYVMFFYNSKVPSWRGYGLHGTYWHSDFGTQRSHGCVNLPTDIAERLYYWVGPSLGGNSWSVRATGDNPGTRIIIHE